jgi:CBS domain containing-hemolysin-like protein
MHVFCEVNHLFIASAIPQNLARQYGRKFFWAVFYALLFFDGLAYFLHWLINSTEKYGKKF